MTGKTHNTAVFLTSGMNFYVEGIKRFKRMYTVNPWIIHQSWEFFKYIQRNYEMEDMQ